MNEVLENNEKESFNHGTKIILHLKESDVEYLEENKIKSIIKTHSQFITYDIKIKMLNEGEKTKEWTTLNKDKPIWCKSPTEVNDDEYKSLYKNISNDYQDCLCYKHFTAEGTIEFKGIIYIPSHPPYDMFNNKENKSFKLYVKRVFIMDDCKDLIPEWLSFTHGIVDTDDLPLNVSREILQSNKVIKIMKKKIILKTIELLDDLSKDEEQYNVFYNNFSKNLKLAIYEENDDIKEKMGKHLRFYSNKSDNLKSLDDYISGMKEGQDKIYYITGESKDFVENSVFLEGLNKKGYEVLYLIDTIDEYMTQNFKKYGGHELVCVSKEDFKLENENENENEKKEEDELCKKIKDILNNKVEKVVISERFVNSPCCLVSGNYGWSANMERIMKAQALNNNVLHNHMTPKKILEINKDHIIMKTLRDKYLNKDETHFKDMVLLMYDIACVSSGFTLTNTNEFAKKLYRILEIGMGAEDTEEKKENETMLQEDKDLEEESEMEQVD
jgi:molecular chaperone HtpG